MNQLWVSLQFFGLIFAELTVLFLGISTLVGLVFEYVSDETLFGFPSPSPPQPPAGR
jgi:hypothetical protein